MAFRRDKADAHQRSADWHRWIGRHRAELVSIGLPPEVYLDVAHWSDFLETGHLHWHESSGFEFTDLSAGRLGALYRFPEREYAGAERPLPLPGWVRVRCGLQ
jgi:hypothetical protein